MTDASDMPDRIWLEYYPEEHFVHFKPVEFVGVVNGAEYVRADLAATLPAPVVGLGLRSDGTIELLAAENRNLRAEIESLRATVSPAPVEALVEALRECRTDLMLQSDYARDAAKTDARWDGIADRLRKRVHEADAALAAYEGERKDA